MIQEIINFVDTLPNEVFTKNLQPKEGLYILLDIDEHSNLVNVDEEGKINEEDIGFYSKKDKEILNVVNKCLPLQLNSKVLNPNKSYNSTQKLFISMGSPFGIGFKKQNFEKATIQKFEAALKQYFGDTAAKSFFDINDKEQFENHKKLERFCKGQLWDFTNQLDEFKSLKKTLEVFIFIKDAEFEWFVKSQENYLSKRLWNDKKYSKSINDEIYGISDNISHFNDKKPYLKHFTATNRFNHRVDEISAVSLYKFFGLQQNRQIPNPMPIFIDKKELTEKAVKLFNDEKGKLGYVDLIKRLLEKKEDLSNYYLIYFDVRAKKSKVIDIDFVSNFRYEMNDVKIKEVFSLNGHLEAKTKVENIFDFEYKIINTIFNNKLIVKNGKWRKYFDDIESKYFTNNNYNQILKYRKSIYDYVFKSRRQAITKTMFDDIMLKGILDDIRLDKYEKGQHTKEYNIKEKLNIWFSLYEYFDYTQFNKSLNKKSMVNKTEELMNRISTIATNDNEHLKNDDEFAFAAGQIIHFLLNKSEAGNRTHALLEPFLQKTDATLLKREIARCFNMYKHAIKFYARKYEFDKIMSEVMGYVSDEKNMKNLLPSTLAGYFAKSTFAKKSEN